MRLFPVGPSDYCDCVSLALWLRNLAYQVETKNNILSSSWSACEWSYRQDQMIKEGDLMMISESDVFISTDRVLQPLDNAGFKAWIYWVCNLSSKNILTTSFACLFANHLKLGFFWNLPCVKKIEQRWSLPSMEVKRLQCRSQHSERWNGNIRLRKHCSYRHSIKMSSALSFFVLISRLTLWQNSKFLFRRIGGSC